MSSRNLTSVASQETHPTQSIEQLRQRFNRLAGSTRMIHRVEPRSFTHVDVILGSLTATSEELAFSLVEKAKQRGAEVTFESLHNFNPTKLVGYVSPYRSPSRLVVFVMSTHMAGRPSSNAESFLRWLHQIPTSVCCPVSESSQSSITRQSDVDPGIEARAPVDRPSSTSNPSPRKQRVLLSQPNAELQSSTTKPGFHLNWRHPFVSSDKPATTDGLMSGIHYTVFGVGNSIYRTYNATAKYVDARLHELGAVRAFPLGLGDASKWIDVTFSRWEAHLLQLVSAPPTSHEVSSARTVESSKASPVPCASSTDKANETHGAEHTVSHGPAVMAQLQVMKPQLARSSSFAKLLMRRRSTLNLLRTPLPALK